jgi:RimJ/RimL family protein N-acetyltransferase
MPGELFPDRIETDRLVFESPTTDHVDVLEYYDICSSDPGIEEVTEYVTWDPHETGNEKSRRAIEKYIEAHGGRHEGELRHHDAWEGEPVDQHRYTITREEYHASGGGPGVIDT